MNDKTGDKSEDFFDGVQRVTESFLTWRKRRQRVKQEKQRRKNTLVDWLEAFIWAACVVLVINQYFIQAYQIPSGSMIDTLLIGDRIIVNKLVYGPELLPGIAKVPSPIKPKRNDIIIFESPEYLSRGPVFDIAQRIIYMATLSLVDIDRDERGQPKAHFLIKRGVGMGGDRFINERGAMLIRFAGETRNVKEADYNKARGFNHNLRRIRAAELDGDIAEVKELCYKMIKNYSDGGMMPPKAQALNDFTLDLNWYSILRGAYPFYDYYTQEYYRLVNGWYVPEGRMLPLGDNRDNSRDGRYFGPVKVKKILGNGKFIYWGGHGYDGGDAPGKTGLKRIGIIK
jgi:signal peptidase I